MIRVRLLSEPEYQAMCQERRCKNYHESDFYDLLREKGDFTDEASCSLLRTLHGEAAVTGKWYRCTTAAGEPCLPAMSPEAKYGLFVIENSRQGIYTGIQHAFTDFEVEERMGALLTPGRKNIPLVWTAFAALEMDILLTFRKKEFSFTWDISLGNDFILENYPIDGVPTPVRVLADRTFRQPELRDGMWCVQNFFYDLQYHWYQETEEVLNYLREESRLIPLAQGAFSMSDFEGMYRERDPYVMDQLERAREEREKMQALGLPYEPEESRWRILNHMTFLPEEGDSRRLLYLIIEQLADGSFRLRNETSVKYPNYDELMEDAIHTYKEGTECFLMPVDVEETMSCTADLHKAVCAFRISGDVIETFDAREGLHQFAQTLRRAINSGRCTIHTGKDSV